MSKVNEPLLFSPILKQIIWGGRRLGERLDKPIGAAADYAESWEMVDRPEDQSIVHRGTWAGMKIGELLAKHGDEIMGRYTSTDAFPLLLKYLDCNRVLSVQVHPDDAYARKMPKPDLGKTEAWYIVEASPTSVIYAGLKAGVDRVALSRAVQAGKTEDVLHSFTPVAGQCVFIPAGTVHALGGGLLVAEVQQSSDTTFRLYDWNRVGADGKPRALHIDASLDVTDYHRGPISPQQPVRGDDGWASLVECEKFGLRSATGTISQEKVYRTGGDDSPVVLMMAAGEATLTCHNWETLTLRVGETVLLPASLGELSIGTLSADANVLEIKLP